MNLQKQCVYYINFKICENSCSQVICYNAVNKA